MGDEADADWQEGLVEWGMENAGMSPKPAGVSCRCGFHGDETDLIVNPYSDVRRCPVCDGGMIRWLTKTAARRRC